MTKNEKYDALKVKGVNLKHINNLSSDEVDKLFTQYIDTGAANTGNTPPDKDEDSQTPPDTGNTPPEPQTKNETVKKVLKFKTSGWCEELKTSYKKGTYHPKSDKEYKALKKYAIQE